MYRIRQLPPFIANQIAAGEVIERPASVVKELLENALDAQATQIHIKIGYGGLNLIQVSDNGTGIVAQDLALAVAPHATSKIHQLEDLYAITSLGFRGEALASIASVSKIIIRSRTADAPQATMLEAVNDSLIYNPCARNKGTTVEVHDIFFNAPVRKKFLKSAQSEFQAIDRVARCFAMSAPTVGISLTHDEKLSWEVNPAYTQAEMLTRITKLLGKKFTDHAHFVEVEHSGMVLQGWLGGADYQRSQNDAMWFYLNHRMVRDKVLFHAIKQAYAPVLHPGRYPGCLIYLTLDPAEVDVNVHPTKHEVRFQQPRLIHDFIISQVAPVWQMESALPHQGQTLGFVENRSTAEASPAFRSSVSDLLMRKTDIIESAAKDLLVIEEIPQFFRNDRDKISTNLDYLGIVHKALDARFSLLWKKEDISVYLLDMQLLSRAWLVQQWLALPRPWDKRRLSFSIGISGLDIDLVKYAEYQLFLELLGLETLRCGDNRLQILSVPMLLPQLDFHSVLKQVFAITSPSIEKIIAIMAASLGQNVLSTTDTLQQQLFVTFLWDACQQSKEGTRILSTALCEELLNED